MFCLYGATKLSLNTAVMFAGQNFLDACDYPFDRDPERRLRADSLLVFCLLL
jgi:hypothetical protein